jgi:transcriptional regulator GlxA family with amidase domain
MKRNTAMAVVVFFIVAAFSTAAFAQKTTVLRVVVVKTDDPAAYAQELEKGKQVMKSLGIQAQTRVWQARFAGPEAGMVVATIEYPNMAAFADAVAKTNASSEYQAWIKGLDKVRKIVSDSLYSEW